MADMPPKQKRYAKLKCFPSVKASLAGERPETAARPDVSVQLVLGIAQAHFSACMDETGMENWSRAFECGNTQCRSCSSSRTGCSFLPRSRIILPSHGSIQAILTEGNMCPVSGYLLYATHCIYDFVWSAICGPCKGLYEPLFLGRCRFRRPR